MADAITATFHYRQNGDKLTLAPHSYSVDAYIRSVLEDSGSFSADTVEKLRMLEQAGPWVLPLLNGDAALRLPNALSEIGEEAFAGVPAETVYLPDGVTAIGERAFADCAALRAVRIPASVTEIADSALSGCRDDLVICGAAGSLAERFAAENGLRFEPEDGIPALLPEI